MGGSSEDGGSSGLSFDEFMALISVISGISPLLSEDLLAYLRRRDTQSEIESLKRRQKPILADQDKLKLAYVVFLRHLCDILGRGLTLNEISLLTGVRYKRLMNVMEELSTDGWLRFESYDIDSETHFKCAVQISMSEALIDGSITPEKQEKGTAILPSERLGAVLNKHNVSLITGPMPSLFRFITPDICVHGDDQSPPPAEARQGQEMSLIERRALLDLLGFIKRGIESQYLMAGLREEDQLYHIASRQIWIIGACYDTTGDKSRAKEILQLADVLYVSHLRLQRAIEMLNRPGENEKLIKALSRLIDAMERDCRKD